MTWGIKILFNGLSAPCADTGAATFIAQYMHRPKAKTYEERSPWVMGESVHLSNSRTSRYKASPPAFISESKHHLTHCTLLHTVLGPFLTNDTINEPICYSEVKVAGQDWNNYLESRLFPEDLCNPVSCCSQYICDLYQNIWLILNAYI